MEAKKFWIIITSLVMAGTLCINFTANAYDAYSNYTILQMVRGGADPIKARCSIYGSRERDAAICTLAVQGKQ